MRETSLLKPRHLLLATPKDARDVVLLVLSKAVPVALLL
jgi:hypothetical protein